MAKGTAMNASSASGQVTLCSWKTRQSKVPHYGRFNSCYPVLAHPR